MKGIQNRVATGFTCLVALLIASGMISLFELNTMSNDTKDILDASRNSMETARDILKCMDEHRTAAMHAAVFGDEEYVAQCDSLLSVAASRIESTSMNLGTSQLDSVVVRLLDLDAISDEYFSTLFHGQPQDSRTSVSEDAFHAESQTLSGEIWYSTTYTPAYKALVDDVTFYISESFESLTPRAEQLQKNAYRSVAPVFIAILVMIAITLIFHYLIHIYCIRPVVRIQKGLNDYLTYGMTYNVKAEKIDEIEELDSQIATLVGSNKIGRNK